MLHDFSCTRRGQIVLGLFRRGRGLDFVFIWCDFKGRWELKWGRRRREMKTKDEWLVDEILSYLCVVK